MSDKRTDEELMKHYLKGDVRAFQVIVERHSGPIFNFILRRCGGNKQLGEDLLQETFLRVVRRRDSFREQSKFTTWLYTIARNLCIDALRRASYRKHPSLDQPLSKSDPTEGATLLDRVSSNDPGADTLTRDKRFRVALQTALDTLPDEQKDIFIMREFQGLKFKEIAQIVGVPENTVKSRMRYALQGLRAELETFAETM